MKKILSINGTSFFSTGNIIKALENGLKDKYEFYRVSADETNKHSYQMCKNYHLRQLGKIPTQIFGNDGFTYNNETKKMIKWVDMVKPDLIHIHNVHGYYMNVELFLHYVYEKNIPVVFTMHDCWSFTGRCAHFAGVNCDKWKEGCDKCQFLKSYPPSRLFDTSKKQWLKKKELFSGHNIHYVVPSNWLMNFTKESFLKNEDVRLIHNGFNSSIFLKKINEFELPKEIDPNKKILLSVANPFTKEKGLDDFNKLQSMIDTSIYQIVLMGITEEYKTVPGIIRIPPTKDRDYLAYLYQNAYAFLLFSYQDNYPTVLLESLASSTPAITYDVGGCPEIIKDGYTGYVVKAGDLDTVITRIEQVDKIDKNECKKVGESHSLDVFIKEYDALYSEILSK